MMRILGASLVLAALAVGCDRNEAERASEKAGQTVTTAADHALDAGKQELKREWNDLDVKVSTGTSPVTGPTLGATDGGKADRSPRPARP